MNPFWTVSLFWIAAAVCVVIALAFILPPLMRARPVAAKAARRDVNIAVYRDQMREMEADRANGLLPEEMFHAARLELEARLAEDALSPDDATVHGRAGNRRLAYAIGAALPVAAFSIYFWLGNPASLLAIADAQASTAPPAMAETQGEHDFMKMIERVEARTRANPEDGDAWAMLAKTYAATQQWQKALPAFEQAIRLLPQEASVLSGYAEALAVNNNNVLAGKPMEWARKALKIDAEDIKGMELAGVNALQEKNFTEAILYFKRLYKLLPPESPYAQDILAAQRQAENLLGQSGPALPGSTQTAIENTTAMAPTAAIIKGRIDIAPALKSRLAPTDVLFVFARSAENGPPLAAMRASAGQLPLEFELNDSMSMNPADTLSSHERVMLVARVSKSGSPKAQAGDLEGTLSNVKPGAPGVKILIDRSRP